MIRFYRDIGNGWYHEDGPISLSFSADYSGKYRNIRYSIGRLESIFEKNTLLFNSDQLENEVLIEWDLAILFRTDEVLTINHLDTGYLLEDGDLQTRVQDIVFLDEHFNAESIQKIAEDLIDQEFGQIVTISNSTFQAVRVADRLINVLIDFEDIDYRVIFQNPTLLEGLMRKHLHDLTKFRVLLDEVYSYRMVVTEENLQTVVRNIFEALTFRNAL